MIQTRKNHTNIAIVFLGSLALCFATLAQAEDLPEQRDWLKSAKADALRLPDAIWKDSKDTFLQRDNLLALALAGGASIAMNNTEADENLDRGDEKPLVFRGLADESFNIIGSPATHFAAAGLWYALSVENADDLNKERAWVMLRALSVTGITTVGLKAARGNSTPNGKKWAWPSGHTSSSFAVASVLDEFYGPQVGIPAYAAASLVGWRMMDTGDHWASDVLFGATLGWVVGHSIAGKHKEVELAGFQVLPYTAIGDESVIGINLAKQF